MIIINGYGLKIKLGIDQSSTLDVNRFMEFSLTYTHVQIFTLKAIKCKDMYKKEKKKKKKYIYMIVCVCVYIYIYIYIYIYMDTMCQCGNLNCLHAYIYTCKCIFLLRINEGVCMYVEVGGI